MATTLIENYFDVQINQAIEAENQLICTLMERRCKRRNGQLIDVAF